MRTPTNLRDEIAKHLREAHGDWSINPHVAPHLLVVGEGVGDERQVFRIHIEQVSDGRNLLGDDD